MTIGINAINKVNVPLIKNGINGSQKLIILVISIVFWIIITEKWKKENNLKLINEKESLNR